MADLVLNLEVFHHQHCHILMWFGWDILCFLPIHFSGQSRSSLHIHSYCVPDIWKLYFAMLSIHSLLIPNPHILSTEQSFTLDFLCECSSHTTITTKHYVFDIVNIMLQYPCYYSYFGLVWYDLLLYISLHLMTF